MPGTWTLKATDGKKYVLVQRAGELKVFGEDNSLFIYGALSATGGEESPSGRFSSPDSLWVSGSIAGFVVPPVEKVAEFPLVKMVMGEGGFQKDEIGGGLQDQVSKPVEDPMEVLEQMEKDLPVERGQYFICCGVRFTIAQTADCFGLIIVQFGNEFEFSLLGLARIRQPRDLSVKPICYIELQILLSVKPSEGSFKLQAVLSNNSWVVSPSCRLTGGFALYAWFGGKHKGDFVITLGGYHPRFRRPDHYPIVPRLGLNWQISESLRIKGELYLAVTSSCFMLGARLEAAFYSSRVSVWFTAYFDALISWSPLHYELDIGVALRAEVDLFLFTIRLTISATVGLWGPPDGGFIRLELSVLTLDVPFGTPRETIPASVDQIVGGVLRLVSARGHAADERVGQGRHSAGIVQPNLAAGRANAADRRAERSPSATDREDKTDRNKVGRFAAINWCSPPPLQFPSRRTELRPCEDQQPAAGRAGSRSERPVPSGYGTGGSGIGGTANQKIFHAAGSSSDGQETGIRVQRDHRARRRFAATAGGPEGLDVGGRNRFPAGGFMGSRKPNPKGPTEPDAKLMQNCITGIKSLAPPAGEYGAGAPPAVNWTALTAARVSRSGELQEIPAGTGARNIQKAINNNQAEQKRVFDALTAAGFPLAWRPGKRRCASATCRPSHWPVRLPNLGR